MAISNIYIEQNLTQHESFLRHLVLSTDIPADQIKQAMLYALFPGGKRLRPRLVYLCGQILNVFSDILHVIAAAVELIHCYSLVHDDLPAMDNDDWRRGKPSCHKAFNEATAMLVGDGMQALAVEILVDHLPNYLPANQVIQVIRELIKASGPAGMVSGQSLDLSELSKKSIEEPQLRQIHILKTGKLIQACCNMVVAAAVSPDIDASKALRDYATHLGLVFQMQDDYLDSYSDPNLLGKGEHGSDAANNKLTFSNLYSKHELYALIAQSYQQAKERLLPLGSQGNDLLAFTDTLHLRNIHRP